MSALGPCQIASPATGGAACADAASGIGAPCAAGGTALVVGAAVSGAGVVVGAGCAVAMVPELSAYAASSRVVRGSGCSDIAGAGAGAVVVSKAPSGMVGTGAGAGRWPKTPPRVPPVKAPAARPPRAASVNSRLASGPVTGRPACARSIAV